MQRNVTWVLAGLAAVLLAGGCQRLNQVQTITVQPGEVRGVRIDPPKQEQKVRVTVTAVDAPVDVYVAVVKDRKLPDDQIGRVLLDSSAGGILVSKKGVKEDTLEATIPAGTEFAVLCGGAEKATSVTIRIAGQ
jgi:hypothetical protein